MFHGGEFGWGKIKCRVKQKPWLLRTPTAPNRSTSHIQRPPEFKGNRYAITYKFTKYHKRLVAKFPTSMEAKSVKTMGEGFHSFDSSCCTQHTRYL